MTYEQAQALQRVLWMMLGKEWNKCAVEPGDGPDDWFVETIDKDGKREQLRSAPTAPAAVLDPVALKAEVAAADAEYHEAIADLERTVDDNK